MNNIIVIGKGGYIGAYITKYLQSQNSYNIIAPSSLDCNFLKLEEVNHFFSSLDSEKHDVIFTAVINKSNSDSYETFSQNVQIVQNFIEGQKKANISSIIYLSSVDVYGINPITPITEATKINPDNWYGLSKYVSEWLLTSSGEITKPIAILRLPGIFGKSHKDNSIIGKWLHSIEKNGKVILHGNGNVLRDYVYIKDLAKIIERFIMDNQTGIFNIATGKCYFIKDIVEIIRKTAEVDFEISNQQVDENRMFNLVFDNYKLKKVISDFQFTDIERGLSSYFI